MKSLGELGNEASRRRYVRELLDYSVSCIEYDVSSAPVSIHLPLSRLVAALTLHLDKYDLNYNSPEYLVKGKPSPEELMEPVLRTQVMIAQVRLNSVGTRIYLVIPNNTTFTRIPSIHTCCFYSVKRK